MSHEAMKWALSVQVSNADEKHTLTILAHHHNAKTGKCIPSQETLAAETGRSVDTIQRHLKSLAEQGLINRERRYVDGYRTSDSYTLAIDGKLKPQMCGIRSKKLKPQMCGVSSDDLTPQNEKLTPQNPDLTPQNTPLSHRTVAAYKDEREEREYITGILEPAAADATAIVRDDDVIIAVAVHPFDQFWGIWPYKHGKADAKKAFEKVLLKIRQGKVTLETVLRGVETYKRTKPDWQQWKLPAGWLRGERWADEPASSQSRPTSDSTMEGLRRAWNSKFGDDVAEAA